MRKMPVIILLICFILIIGGCSAQKVSEPAAASPDAENQVETAPLNLTLAGGSTNGVWYMVSNGISECINKSYPGSVTTILPGNGVGNAIRINRGEVNAGLATSAMLYAANQGTDPYKEKLSNLAAVAMIHPTALQIVVRKDMGVTSFQEILDKKLKIRLSIDQQGSQASALFIQLLEAYGVSEKDLLSWGGQLINKGQEEASGMYVDGMIDGFILLTLYPAPAIQEGDLGRDMVLLPLDPGVITTLCEKYGYNKIIIPTDAYRFTSQDSPSVCSNTVLAIPKNASDEAAYKLARSLVENLDFFKNVHVAIKNLTPKMMVEDLGVPLHPGAKKYFQEIGILPQDI